MPTSGPRRSWALLDTNVLVYAMNADAPNHAACRALRDEGQTGVLDLCLTSQVLFEYFAVVTNPNSLPVPLTNDEATRDIAMLATTFPILPGPADIAERVIALLRTTGMTGRHVYDLVLAATMLANDVRTVYTFDARFSKIPGLVAKEPSKVRGRRHSHR